MNELKDKEDLQNEKFDIEKIVKEYSMCLNSIINNKVGNKLSFEDKEEILTDAFFVLWKNKDKVTSSIKSYLIGVVNNLIKEKCVKKKITYNINDFENSVEFSNVCVFEQSDKFEIIEEIISKLREEDKKIIKLFYYEDMSIKSIAKKLNISEGNVKIRLFRLRKLIRKEVKAGDK